MFKSESHKSSFENYRDDYETFLVFVQSLSTRLAEKNWEKLEELFREEIYSCFTDEFLAKAQAWMEKNEKDGDLDGLFEAVHYFEWTTRVPQYLIEAYEGYYETEMANDLTVPMEEPDQVRTWVFEKMYNHTPRQNLEIYLEWNGIIGYTDHIIDIFLKPVAK